MRIFLNLTPEVNNPEPKSVIPTSYTFKPRLRSSWTPELCKIMAFMAVIMGLGLLVYILLGFRFLLFTTLQ